MNERIILHLVEFSPDRSVTMVRLARTFASSKPDGRPGMRHGTVYGFGDWSAIAYWTARRTVVVRELGAT